MKNKWYFLLIPIYILFILIPLPASDLYLKISLDPAETINSKHFYLYYATKESGFSDAQVIPATFDAQSCLVSFRISADLEGKITSLRMDYPACEQLLKIMDVSVSSGGLIQKHYNPSNFFTMENLAGLHGLKGVDPVPTRAISYVSTTEDDPYVVLSDASCHDISRHFSHYRFTRILICLYVTACIFFARKKLFKE